MINQHLVNQVGYLPLMGLNLKPSIGPCNPLKVQTEISLHPKSSADVLKASPRTPKDIVRSAKKQLPFLSPQWKAGKCGTGIAHRTDYLSNCLLLQKACPLISLLHLPMLLVHNQLYLTYTQLPALTRWGILQRHTHYWKTHIKRQETCHSKVCMGTTVWKASLSMTSHSTPQSPVAEIIRTDSSNRMPRGVEETESPTLRPCSAQKLRLPAPFFPKEPCPHRSPCPHLPFLGSW